MEKKDWKERLYEGIIESPTKGVIHRLPLKTIREIIREKEGIIKVTEKEMLKIIDTYKPLGRFISGTKKEGFVAVDNIGGEAWTEEFPTEERANKWLNEVY